jgi:hypothetical protein
MLPQFQHCCLPPTYHEEREHGTKLTSRRATTWARTLLGTPDPSRLWTSPLLRSLPIRLPWVGAEPKPEEASVPLLAAARAEPQKERTPRVDWPGCCAGASRWMCSPAFGVEAGAGERIDGSRWGRAILEHLGLPSRAPKSAPAQGPPQQRTWC